MKLGDDLYVLHAFKKKSKSGIKTPKSETELVKRRLKQVKEQLRKKA
ncbi:type II toxin-antitoxin system RelE/ParE family toxin [Celeribacter halophilus]|nr:type II toxin-antitoxin system RelE/ParE family toxin [Celeribacter halophilus]MDO6721652.1 type II toxin-antitoxin system RelE/ParE family toxin [Celeribacter halophilus]